MESEPRQDLTSHPDEWIAREALEKKVSLCLQMFAMERELCGRAGRETHPLEDLWEATGALAELPAANPKIVKEDWQREVDNKADSRRPRYRVEAAAGLAAQAYDFAFSLRNEHLLNSNSFVKLSSPLDEAISALEEAALNVLLEFGQVLRQEGDLIAVGEPEPVAVAS